MRSLLVPMTMSISLAGLPALAGCDAAIPPPPDAGGPSLVAVWDPRVCGGVRAAQIELRLEDDAGRVAIAADACVACRLELAVGHPGWYAAHAVVLDAAGGGRALARATLAIDAPDVRWRVPWIE